MSDLLTWLEGSPLAVWTRESPSLWAYPTILALHSAGLGVVVGASIVVDLRLIGFARRIRLATLAPLFPMIWWAFALNAASGFVLFMADATIKSTQTVFMVKLGCIAAALLVTLRIRRIVLQSAAQAVTSPPQPTWAVLSLILWAAAITAGRMMAYF